MPERSRHAGAVRSKKQGNLDSKLPRRLPDTTASLSATAAGAGRLFAECLTSATQLQVVPTSSLPSTVEESAAPRAIKRSSRPEVLSCAPNYEGGHDGLRRHHGGC